MVILFFYRNKYPFELNVSLLKQYKGGLQKHFNIDELYKTTLQLSGEYLHFQVRITICNELALIYLPKPSLILKHYL